jgi:hypothetical protein
VRSREGDIIAKGGGRSHCEEGKLIKIKKVEKVPTTLLPLLILLTSDDIIDVECLEVVYKSCGTSRSLQYRKSSY